MLIAFKMLNYEKKMKKISMLLQYFYFNSKNKKIKTLKYIKKNIVIIKILLKN